MGYCAWGNHSVPTMHATNKNVTVGFCEACSTEALHAIQYANVAKLWPDRYPGVHPHLEVKEEP